MGSNEDEKKPADRSSPRRPRIWTIADFSRPFATITSGPNSERLVQDPTKGADPDVFINLVMNWVAIAENARPSTSRSGAVEETIEPSTSTSFTGIGRVLLSGEEVPAASQPPPESVTHYIVLWNDGFTVNDGPFRRFNDPTAISFLETITRWEYPIELKSADRRTQVYYHLTRYYTDRPEPESRTVPFQGVGRTLGEIGETSSSSTAETTTAAPSDAPLTSSPSPSLGLVVDPNQPTTQIQVRLVDGTRVVAYFNLHHTINDIRAFIDASRPGGSVTYRLQSGFPPKELEDLNQTIEQAGLANSVIIQKL